MKRVYKRWAAALFTLLYLVCSAVPALAYTFVDTGREASLSVFYKKNDTIISGASFSLYRVADMSDRAYYTLSGSYADYAVELNELDSEGWRAAAETLAAYTARDEIAPHAAGKTDEQGRLSFGNLDTGLYLLTGEKVTIWNDTYTPEPCLISLPGIDGEDQWIYDRTVSPKAEMTHDPNGGNPDPDHVSRKVLKVWENDRPATRPAQVTVQLLQDGEVYDTVVLNEENGWSHTWPELEKDHEWQVTEADVPKGYVVSVSREGITFVVTNRKPSSSGGGGGGGGSRDPGGDNPGDNTPGGGEPEEGIPNDGQGDGPIPPEPIEPVSLPQTGISWYLVPILAGSGLMVFFLGWYLRQRRRDER